MRTSLQPGKGLKGYFFMDAIVGLLILILLLAGVFQAFQSLSVLVVKEEKATLELWEKISSGSKLETHY